VFLSRAGLGPQSLPIASHVGWNHRCKLLYLACWLRWCLANVLPGLAFNSDSLDLQLQSSWDHRHAPPLVIPFIKEQFFVDGI
jgi:hypothetical protein